MTENAQEIRTVEEEELEIVEELTKAQSKDEKKKKRKTRMLLWLLFIIFIGIVVAVTAVQEFSNKPAEKLGFTFGLSNYLWLLAAFGCVAAALIFETTKYLLMMRALKVRVSLRMAFETAALGKFYDNVTPSGVGGQPFQIYKLHKAGYKNGASVAMPLTAFLTMQTGFVLLAIIMFIIRGSVVDNIAVRIPAYIGIVLYMIAPGMIVLFTFSREAATRVVHILIGLAGKLHILKHPENTIESILKILEEHRSSILMMGGRKGLFVILFSLSFLFQLAISSIPFFVLLAYNGWANYFDILAMTLYVYCAVTMIPTPGNAGAAEGAFYLIFSQLDPIGLFWAMLVWRGFCYYLFIVIGFVILAVNAIEAKREERKKAANEEGGGDPDSSV